MSKFRNWKEVKKEIESDFTPEELEEMKLEKDVILATIAARKNANLTQKELSEKTGIIQPSIAKIEKFARIPQYTTLIKLLYPLGYTLKVVPLKDRSRRTQGDVQ